MKQTDQIKLKFKSKSTKSRIEMKLHKTEQIRIWTIQPSDTKLRHHESSTNRLNWRNVGIKFKNKIQIKNRNLLTELSCEERSAEHEWLEKGDYSIETVRIWRSESENGEGERDLHGKAVQI